MNMHNYSKPRRFSSVKLFFVHARHAPHPAILPQYRIEQRGDSPFGKQKAAARCARRGFCLSLTKRPAAG
jgi:hypothetical protein